MSDSESSEEIEVKVELQHEAKVRELIEKGKTILPYYSEESLFHIYKQSFQNETNFLDKLHVIVRNQKLMRQEGQQEWIINKKHQKSQVNHRSRVEENLPKRQRYNFLEDKKLIERALKYQHDKAQRERERDNRAKNAQQYRPRPAETQAAVNNSASNVAAPLDDKEKPQHKKEKTNLYKEKKVLYKQKEVVPEPAKTETPVKEVVEKKPVQVKAEEKHVENKPAPEPVVEKTEPKPKFAEKKIKYAEKKEPVQTPKYEEKKAEPVKAQQAAKIEVPVSETKASSKVEKKVEPKQQVPKVEPVKVEPAPVTATQAPVEVKTESTKKIASQKEIPSKAEVDSQFENSLNQNSFILKFIKPSNKLQQVSYIRYPDGRMADIKVKEPLEQKY